MPLATADPAPGRCRRHVRPPAAWWRALILACGLAAAPASRAALPEIALAVGGHKLVVEVAASDPARAQGLMHRRMLPENRGMLFVFRETALHAMWMMNTYVPLSVAFLDEKGVIINIEDMQPHTQDTHPAARPAKYALEVNQGWFRKRGIKPGARIEGLDLAPPPR
ncbi:MAG: DUF192 domain-containing protein [Burkholderiales bacterium]|nr:DUF192 domain-containing protein [Burkholderiales bacterium]